MAQITTRRLRSETVGDEDDVFDSGIKLIQNPNLFIGTELLAICDAIQAEHKGLEWSIMLKGVWIEQGYSISKSYVIPDQEVDGSNVYLNDKEVSEYTGQGYNVIIHSHPFNMTSFSGSDMDTLSATADCSILYCLGKFVTSTIALKVARGLKLIVEPQIVMIPNMEMKLPDTVKTKIKERHRSPVSQYNSFLGHNIGFDKTEEGPKQGDSFQETFAEHQNVFEFL